MDHLDLTVSHFMENSIGFERVNWLIFLYSRHILFAESSIDTYSGSSFPGLADAMFEIEQSPDPAARWKIVQKHYSVILYLIQAAGATLRDVSDFMYSY